MNTFIQYAEQFGIPIRNAEEWTNSFLCKSWKGLKLELVGWRWQHVNIQYGG
jgi:hypothetical protein